MSSDKIQKRLTALFSDVDRLVTDPELSASLRDELEALRTRVEVIKKHQAEVNRQQELELQAPAGPRASAGAPIIYEKEHVGYAYSGNGNLERTTRHELADLEQTRGLKVPLVETGQTIGEVFVESPSERSLGSDEAGLAEAIARQASIQIQNLRLLEAAQRARAEAISATRQFTHQSWENFLDAINEREKIGYVYDQNEVSTLTDTALAVDYEASVSVLDQKVGKLYLQSDPRKPLTELDKALADAVAQQVAQQVENLRLLAEATRARAAADELVRQTARENWQTFVATQTADQLGFVYDSNQVVPLSFAPEIGEINHIEEIAIQGESVGQLAVAGSGTLDAEQKEFLAAIAARVSTHVETLRLNEELRKRAFELQELDRLKSSFLANMSHELRTPLNAILGFSDVMLEGIDGPLTDYMENDLKLIQKNGQHLLSLINDVLDMAKIESGRMALHPELFSLNELFEDVFSITSSLANSKSLKLQVAEDSDRGIMINADVTRIRQVMINIVTNAIKFTEQGGITVQATHTAHQNVMIIIKDTGLGIPQDHLESIFQEFSQVDTSTTRKAGGTGLGLPISRRLIEMHGGRMWAESDGIAGHGSTFFIELPLETKIESEK